MKLQRPFKLGNWQSKPNKGLQVFGALKFPMVAVFVATTLFLPPTFAAASGSDLDKLEMRFFHHNYSKDTTDARLDRLEKMVFGEAKEGADRERIDSMMKLVADGDDDPTAGDPGATAGGDDQGRSSPPPKRATSSSNDDARAAQPPRQKAPPAPKSTPSAPREDEGTAYPAVSAIEKKLFGREFLEDDVNARLARLETRVFGKPSKSNDLSERMDALKDRTGVDVARAPAGSEWNEEDEEGMDYPEPSAPSARRVPGVTPKYADETGRSFSGRNVADDLNRAFNRRPATGSGGSGSYGMGGGSYSSSGSGSYGFGSGGNSRSGMGSSSIGSGGGFSSGSRFGSSGGLSTSMPGDDDSNLAYAPPKAPDFRRRGAPPPDSSGLPPTAPQRGSALGGGSPSGGLTQQVEALETQIFGKTYQKDPLPDRVDRLENTIFPGNKAAKSKPLPERVLRISSVIPTGQNNMMSQNQAPQDVDGDGMPDGGGVDPNSQIAQQTQRNRGGLGKIINGLGNFLSGGMSVGSYPMPTGSGNLVTDPQTGMLLDQFTGNLINPNTGAVVGRKAGFGYQTPVVPGYGMNTFNNGFSSPYNPMYSSPAYGIGGSGVRFGTGMGGVRFGGGVWP